MKYHYGLKTHNASVFQNKIQDPSHGRQGHHVPGHGPSFHTHPGSSHSCPITLLLALSVHAILVLLLAWTAAKIVCLNVLPLIVPTSLYNVTQASVLRTVCPSLSQTTLLTYPVLLV